ncbi:MAG: sugar O-acetyltransferase [Rhodocyclaceae bacterium]|nr:sugar O-acetyltransferase [Rhodocyclaceae bacterium]
MPKTEKEKMLAGELYNGMDPALVAERLQARELCQALAVLPPTAAEAAKADLLAQLFGAPTNVYITPPFFCDYGTNIRFGENVYFNFNCVVLDVAQVTIGDNTLFGPMVQIYTATHPMEAEARRSGLESGKPVTIGKDVWVGGGAIICPGVTIGDGSVIGAGSVVTRDIPTGVFAAGNPCRVIRKV